MVAVFLLSACSSSPTHPTHSRETLLSDLVRVRRPPGTPADPTANLGDPEYKSSLPVGKNLGCEKPEWLFEGTKLSFGAIRRCLRSITHEAEVEYQMDRGFEPRLFLDLEDDEVPNCLKQVLPEVRLPREIFYWTDSSESEKIQCYASGLNLDKNRILGVTLPVSDVGLVLQFPFSEARYGALETDASMQNLVLSWVLSLFFEEGSTRVLQGRYVPNSLCKTCFQINSVPKDAPSLREITRWPKAKSAIK